jgi:hypothetical protein
MPDSTKTTGGAERPRTWTLEDIAGSDRMRVKPRDEPSFAGITLVQVIELEPVLDLLERCRINTDPSSVLRDVETILAEHGRLP